MKTYHSTSIVAVTLKTTTIETDTRLDASRYTTPIDLTSMIIAYHVLIATK